MFNIDELLAAIDSKKKSLATDFVDLMTNPKEFILRNQTAQKEAGDSYTEDLLNKLGKATSDPNALRAPPFEEPMDSPLDLYGGMLKGAIIGWPGGPHLFKKFDWSKIGTGEGNKIYGDIGKGHYIPEVPATGRWYAHSTQRPKVVGTEGETILSLNRLDDMDSPEFWAATVVKDQLRRDGRVNFDEAIAQVRTWVPGYRNDPEKVKAMMDGIKMLEDWKKKGFSVNDLKHQYKVELAWPDPAKEAAEPLSREHFLQLDAPLGVVSQPQAIRSPKELFKSGSEFYHDLIQATGSEEEAIKYLQEKGIPGLRYLDQLSREGVDPAKQSFNYIVQSDDLIRILEHILVPDKKKGGK